MKSLIPTTILFLFLRTAYTQGLPGQTLQGFSNQGCSGNAGNIDNCENGSRCILWTGRQSAQLTDANTGGLANIFVKVFQEGGCEGSGQILQLGPGCQDIPTGNSILCCQQGVCPSSFNS